MTAWFNKYLQNQSSADNWLLTQRWRNDPVEAGVDPNHDPNAFSFYSYSRLDIHLANGSRWDCEDLRDGCPGMVANDGYNGDYSYIKIDTTPDASLGGGAFLKAGSGLATCPAHSGIKVALHRVHGRPVTKVKVYVDGKLVATRRGHNLRAVKISGLAGKGRHRLKILVYTRKGLAKRITRTVYGCQHKAARRHHKERKKHAEPKTGRHRDHDGDYDGD
jgi:hypothetical protein